MYFNVKALIIREFNLREGDKYITAITDTLGKINININAAFKNGQFNACSQLFAYSDMVIFENRGKYKINSASLVEQFFEITQDVEKMALASYFCQAAGALTVEGQSGSEVLGLLVKAFQKLSTTAVNNLRLIKAAFEVRLASVCGYMPYLEKCGICGREPVHAVLNAENGCICCEECIGFSKFRTVTARLTRGALDAMRYIIRSDDDKIFNFSLGEKSLESLAQAAEIYFLHKTEQSFKALDVYKSLVFSSAEIM